MELGLFETMVWVDRIEPLYFIPLSELFASQSLSGYGDNSFAGVSGSIYLPQNLRFDSVIYADDYDFSGILKGRFDTKWKIAAQASLSWAPESPLVQLVGLDYTAIGPYTYTHWADGGTSRTGLQYNGALAYTNGGVNIGPALEPNSDRVTLSAKSRTIQGLQVSGEFRMIRHGNASAGVAYYTNATSASGNASGDIGDSGQFKTDPTNPPAVWNNANIFAGDYATGTSPKFFRFLTQDVLQTSFQFGVGADYSLPVPGLGSLEAGASYLFEYILNNNLMAGSTSIKHYLSVKVGMGF
jgi:hypothetical protein